MMKLVDDVEDGSLALEDFVVEELKSLGIKVPIRGRNAKTGSTATASTSIRNVTQSHVFGCQLSDMDCVDVQNFGPIPKFVVDIFKLIEKDVDCEGIFRKSSSISRLKELRMKVEAGDDIGDAHAVDFAALLKLFVRELSEPIFTNRLQDSFAKCHSLAPPDCETALFLLCAILPVHHRALLRYLMCFLNRISSHCVNNKMDASNLAVCFTPNMFRRNNMINLTDVRSENEILHSEAAVIQVLIEKYNLIGMISDDLAEKVSLLNTFPDSDVENEAVKGRKRSSSFQGLVSNLSTSFTKWRNKEKWNGGTTNISFNSSSVAPCDVRNVDPSNSAFSLTSGEMVSAATPCLIRKRKAVVDTPPFSLRKRKVILENMPQFSSKDIASFTPVRKCLRIDDVVDIDSHELLRSQPVADRLTKKTVSGVVIRRTGSMGQSQESSRRGFRKSFEGFIRRLSGGREAQTDDSRKLPDGGHSYLGFPRSPSTPEIALSNFPQSVEFNDSMSHNFNQASNVGDGLLGDVDLNIEPNSCQHTCIESLTRDDSLNRAHILKRGQPNTERTGLPSPLNRRFIGSDKDLKTVSDVCDGLSNEILLDASPITAGQSPPSNIPPSPVETKSSNQETELDCAFLDSQHDKEMLAKSPNRISRTARDSLFAVHGSNSSVAQSFNFSDVFQGSSSTVVQVVDSDESDTISSRTISQSNETHISTISSFKPDSRLVESHHHVLQSTHKDSTSVTPNESVPLDVSLFTGSSYSSLLDRSIVVDKRLPNVPRLQLERFVPHHSPTKLAICDDLSADKESGSAEISRVAVVTTPLPKIKQPLMTVSATKSAINTAGLVKKKQNRLCLDSDSHCLTPMKPVFGQSSNNDVKLLDSVQTKMQLD